jgi:hypothetical protein
MRTSVTWKELGRRHLPRGIRFEGFEMRRDVEDYPGKRAAMEQNKVPKSAYISKGDSVDLGAYLEVLSVINGTINCAVLSKFVATSYKPKLLLFAQSLFLPLHTGPPRAILTAQFSSCQQCPLP